MKDSGKKQQFESGAQRDSQEGKGRYDLIKQCFLDRVAKWLALGAEKYGDRNWELGQPTTRCMDSLLRHAYKANEKWDDEDHLAAVAVNAMFVMFMEENKPEIDNRVKGEVR